MTHTLKVRVDKLAFHCERINPEKYKEAYDYWQTASKQDDSPKYEIHRLWCRQHAAKTTKSKS